MTTVIFIPQFRPPGHPCKYRIFLQGWKGFIQYSAVSHTHWALEHDDDFHVIAIRTTVVVDGIKSHDFPYILHTTYELPFNLTDLYKNES